MKRGIGIVTNLYVKLRILKIKYPADDCNVVWLFDWHSDDALNEEKKGTLALQVSNLK